MMPGRHILEADCIRLSYGDREVLRSVWFCAWSGVVTLLTGPNGSGKSTLFRILCGSLRPGQGQVRLDGSAMTLQHAFRQIKYMPQFNYIPGHLSVARVFHDYSVSYDEFVSCFPEADCRPEASVKQLSGGVRRLIEAFTVLKSPSLFAILDEPFTHVSPVMAERLKDVITSELRSGKGVIVADHLSAYMPGFADVVFTLGDGKIRRPEAASR